MKVVIKYILLFENETEFRLFFCENGGNDGNKMMVK